MDSRFRGNDGLSFADFHRQTQLHLFSSIDNALSQKAESIITDNFAAVKKAGIQLQTKLGGRKGNIGVNLIGAFAETDNRAFGWQLRAYGGQDSVKGANAGVFYRTIDNGALYGANAFLDYEDGDYGDFSRYGIGGELSHSVFALAANYYIPQTDNRRVNATVAAFSRKGYDAKLRLNAPGYREVKAVIDYYHFDGKGKTENDKGWRYGLEFVPIPSFHFALYYDDSAETIGGDIGYSHTIGKVQKRESNAAFSPDMFAAVSREYSQRIATVEAVGISLRITPILTMTNAVTAAAITTTITMTADLTTAMTMTMTMSMATRMANVQATTRIDGGSNLNYRLLSTRHYILATLPPETAQRPYVLTITTNMGADINATANPTANYVLVIGSNQGFIIGDDWAGLSEILPYTLTIVEGSEIFISVTTTLTTSMTTTMAMRGEVTETTMTMLAVSTTTRITTFSTMTILLTANAAMGGEIPAFLRMTEKAGIMEMANAAMGDSRFRGNDERGDMPPNPPPNFPQIASADIPIIRLIALKGRPVHSTGQRPVSRISMYQAL
ncbi:MAG: inverse autotransporter beta domain-containing protein [Gammaproteobacteria bacterium]